MSQATATPLGPSPLAAWVLLSLPLLAVVAACYGLLGSEDAVAAFFSAWRPGHPDATYLVKLYTNWGNPALYLVYAGFLVHGLKQKRRGLTALALAYLAGQLLVSVAIERLFKISLGRPRPGVGGPFLPFSFDAAHHSLPSGHSVEITLQTLPLALRDGLGRAQTLCLPIGLGLVAGLMGLSRIVLGAHHPSDVLAGWLVGSLGGLFILWLAPRIASRLPAHWSA